MKMKYLHAKNILKFKKSTNLSAFLMNYVNLVDFYDLFKFFCCNFYLFCDKIYIRVFI